MPPFTGFQPAETTPKAHILPIIVYGVPAPQGSKKHVGGGVMVESNAGTLRTWREDVKHAALRAMETHPWWMRDYTQIVAHVTFTLARPKGHYRTGRFAHLLRDDAPSYHGSKPDLDKLLRSTGDALTAAGAYVDDARIVSFYAVKAYTSSTAIPPGVLDRPGARIVLTGTR